MAEFSYPNTPHNARQITEAEFERLVFAEELNGLIGTPALTDLIYSDGTGTRQFKVRANRELKLRGFLWNSGTTERAVSLGANVTGLTRFDRVVLRLTRSTWEINLVVIAGVAGSGVPAAVKDLGGIGVYDFSVAVVQVNSGDAVTIADKCLFIGSYLGPARILCKSTSRPDYEPGLTFTEYDTGITYTCDSTSTPKVVAQNTGWVPQTVGAGWLVERFFNVMIRDNTVFMSFWIKRTGANQGNGEFFIPVVLETKFRPSLPMSASYTVQGTGTTKTGLLSVDQNGQVFMFPNADSSGLVTTNAVVVATLSWPANN